MDPQLVRQWKAGYDAVNAVTLAEAKERTSEQRFTALLSFVESLSELGMLRPRSDDLEYHLRWQLLREGWIARNA